MDRPLDKVQRAALIEILIESLSITTSDARDVTNASKYHMIVAYKGN